jgi:serine/threonine protein kinase
MYQLLKEKKNNERVGIESFKFYKKIGEGAFGEVYIVKKGKSEKLYALKAIKKQKIIGTNIMRYIQT